MKKIGKTDDGNILLEASPDEYLMLEHLAMAVEGKPLEYVHLRDDHQLMMPDFYGVFGAIEAFSMTHYRVNDLQMLLDSFRAKVNGDHG